MLSISDSIIGFGKGNYYLALAREDYYFEGGEPPGIWLGKGSESLGVDGKVTKDELRNLMLGYSADGNNSLVQNAGKDDRRSAWDLTFSAPKSVSVAWSQADREIRKEIETAHFEAVKKAINYLDENAAITRRGKGSREIEPVNLAVASFEHGTSRAQDPQLHTHCLVLNVAKRYDGSYGAIESFPIFQRKMGAGALYRAELSYQLEKRLGLLSYIVDQSFEIKGIPKDLCLEFSKRRKEIEAVLLEKGYSSAIASKIITLNTREVKGHIARKELFRLWQDVGVRLKFSQKDLNKLINYNALKRDYEYELNTVLRKAITKITDSKSSFLGRDVVRFSAMFAQGRGINTDDLLNKIDKFLTKSQEIVVLGRDGRDIRYTTKEVINLEKKFLENVKLLSKREAHTLSTKNTEMVLKKRETISSEQKEAFNFVTLSKSSINVISGMAGTGKSYALGAIKDAYELENYKVYGAALSGKASDGLIQDAKINSQTVHQTLINIENKKINLDSKSVLIIDEAGMLGTRYTNKLLELSVKNRTKIILVGDVKQLQPIEAGGALKAISKRIGEVKLKEIRRQKSSWAKKAVHDFADGNSHSGLKEYAKRGLLDIQETKEEAIESLISKWFEKGISSPKDNIILAGTNLETHILNKKIQSHRLEKEDLGRFNVNLKHLEFYKNDRVLFTKNSKLYGVKNGSLGTIFNINRKRNEISVLLDSGEKTKISLNRYQNISLGYAITTHKAQGISVDNAYVLLGGHMQDRELSYVQLSRAKNNSFLFTDRLEAGDKLTNLARQMATSRQKTIAHDFKSKKFNPLTLNL